MECSAADRFCVRDLSSVRDLRLDNPSLLYQGSPQPFYRYYVLAHGMWQWWAIFAPDPVRNTIVLDAEIVDAKGMRHIFEFPRIAELPWWQKIARYRQPKFTGNMANPEYFVATEVHGPIRGAADGSRPDGVSPVGEPLLSGQGYAPARVRRPSPTRWLRRVSRCSSDSSLPRSRR